MTSGFYRYSQLTRNGTEYARRMERLRCRIFTETPTATAKPNRRIVRMLSEMPKYKDPELTLEYYPRLKDTYYLMVRLRQLGLYRDEHEDFKEEMKRLRRLRGKGPPPRKIRPE